jgi:hypothetical protein
MKQFFMTLWLNIKKWFIKSLVWIIPISVVAVIAFFIIRKLSDPTDSAKEFEQLLQNFKLDWQTKKSEINNKIQVINDKIDQIKSNKIERQSVANQYIKPKL